VAVLHVVQYALPEISSGYTVRTAAIVAHQRALGLDPLIVTSPRHPAAHEGDVEGVFHYRCQPERRARSVWLRDWSRCRVLARRIREIASARGDVRLIHAHSPVLCGLAAIQAGRRLGLPVVYEVRGLWEEAMRGRSLRYRLARRTEAAVCARADAVVAICRGLRDDLVKRGVAPAKLHIVPNGVDAARFTPAAELPGGPRVLYLGALRAYEGLELLLEAFSVVRRSAPQVQLLIVGQGEHRARIAEAARAVGEGATVAPPVPHSEVQALYAAAHAVVYPRLSTRATETVTPLKPLEAMAMAKAIVASDVGGLRELLCDGRTARLFAAGSAAALAGALAEVLGDAGLRRRLGEAAREAARELDWARVVRRYLDVYEQAGAR